LKNLTSYKEQRSLKQELRTLSTRLVFNEYIGHDQKNGGPKQTGPKVGTDGGWTVKTRMKAALNPHSTQQKCMIRSKKLKRGRQEQGNKNVGYYGARRNRP
jgi:hypothetical protein